MELKQLQSFCAVVEYRSFTKAAEKLYISQPTISTHIRQLEEELQTLLLIRTTKSLNITPRGMELYECAGHMLSLQNNLKKHWSEENRSVIRIGASTIPSAYVLPDILPAFRKRYPDAEFSIYQGDSQRVIDGLLTGNYEVGLVGSQTQEEGLEFVPFLRDTMVLITPATERYRKWREGYTVADIVREPLLFRQQGSGSKKWIEAYIEQCGLHESELRIMARLNDQETIKGLVAGGLGISIISAKAAADYEREGKLLTFALPDAPVGRWLYLVYRKDDYFRPQTKQLIRFVRQYYAEEKA